MIKIGQYIPLHLSVFLTLGIILGYYFEVPLLPIIISILLLFSILFLLLKFKKKTLFQIVSYVLSVLTGLFVITFQNPTHQSQHYTHFATNENSKIIQVERILKSNAYQDRYFGNLLQVDSHATAGKIALVVMKDSTQKPLRLGQIFVCNATFEKPLPPKNPHTFDYGRYLKNQEITEQVFLKPQEIFLLDLKKDNLIITAGKWREKIQESLRKFNFGEDEMATINALLLGDRQLVSSDMQQYYADAGVIHILSVSGLHVGILFLLLSALFQPLERINKGKIIKTILVVLLLWGFALISGLSPSVVRSVTMFTFVAIGLTLKNQQSPVLYALITSYFILLLIHPLFIFDVGFQLSYSAVLGIVLFQPLLRQVFTYSSWFLPQKIWGLISVSVAATLGTLPLSLFYFHQFPGLFILSNIVIVPFSSLILGMGVLVSFLALWDILPSFLVVLFNQLVQWMNFFIHWIATQEEFLLKNIPFSLTLMMVSYLVISLFYRWIIDRKLPKFYSFLLGVLLLQSVFIYEKWQAQVSREFLIFHKNNETVIGIKNGRLLEIYHSKDSFQPKSYPFINNYKTANRIDSIDFKPLKSNVFQTKEFPLLLIDSMGIYQNITFKPKMILLTQSSKINLERLISIYQPKTIIADASNFRYRIKQWELTCKKHKIPFHYTVEDGAFIQ